jgi:outer membrane protein OmpA-like peptidoglycan-associated protein
LKVLLVALFAAWLASQGGSKEAPATPALFVVVPSTIDGHVGSIVVTRTGGQPQVIDRAYAAQKIASDGTITAVTLSQAEVSAAFGPTLAALPGKPATFVLYFLEGKDELTSESRAELDKVFEELKRRPLPDIVVIGHTDTVGNDAVNDRLSLARAERTREMMVGMGIASERVEAAGRGKRELLVPTPENVSEPRNRRVEINVR